METPLLTAVNEYLQMDMSRFHMPGHKGADFLPFQGASRYDLTEIADTDSLYNTCGPIGQTEKLYAEIYGTQASLISAGGSTLCIQTMLTLVASPGDTIIAGRGVHTAAVNTMALMDLRPAWVYPRYDPKTGLSGPLTPESIREKLIENPAACAVYITSPNYFGIISDVQAIADVCDEFGVPLLVDNAHGAHLKFLPRSLHPMDLGADICGDSLHKTLPVFTGGAMLHINTPRFVPDAKRMMSIYGSTSPSYLIMLSIDTAIPYLKNHVRDHLAELCATVAELRELAIKQGFAVPRAKLVDPTRLSLGFGQMGYTRQEFSQYLRDHKISPEYLSDNFCVLFTTGFNTAGDFERVRRAILDLPAKKPLIAPDFRFHEPAITMTLRQAMFAPSTPVPVEEALGRIASGIISPCPPGIPIAVSGERIDGELARLLKNYGISTVNVLVY